MVLGTWCSLDSKAWEPSGDPRRAQGKLGLSLGRCPFWAFLFVEGIFVGGVLPGAVFCFYLSFFLLGAVIF